MHYYPRATNYLIENVSSSAGGCKRRRRSGYSGLEMSQNAEHLSWTFEEEWALKLQKSMESIYTTCFRGRCNMQPPSNLVFSANIAGFLKVANAMIAQGVC